MIIIEHPVYYGDLNFKERCIGIAEHALENEPYNVDIQIAQLRSGTNNRLFPNTYTMSKKQILSYRTQQVGHSGKVTVHMIPIKDLRVKPQIQITKIVNCPLNNNKTEVLAVQKSLFD